MSEPEGAKTRDKTTNWAAYNAALKVGANLTTLPDREVRWYAPVAITEPPRPGGGALS